MTDDTRPGAGTAGLPTEADPSSDRPPAPAACTGLALSTVGGDQIVARTIEWGHFSLDSRLIVSPRGHRYTSALPLGTHGVAWTGRLGFVGISVSEDRYIGEGVNEEGLNAGLFYFARDGSLAPFDPTDTVDRIADMDLVRWMLSRFASVQEVEGALPDVTVAPVHVDTEGRPSPTAHWRVADRSGRSIVVEITDEGRGHIHENHVGVVTNSPRFPWHVTNLDNYVNVRPGTIAPHALGDLTYSSFGTGTAALGLPGDYSPTSRFVRAAFFRATAPPLPTAEAAVAQAFHILNNFDIPIGVEFGDHERDRIPDLPSATQWTAVSDLTNAFFYFATMYDPAVKRVRLDRLDLASGTESAHALDHGRFTYSDLDLAD